MIGEKIKSLRKAKGGLSQAALADALGVTQQAVGNWEKNKNMPDNDIQIKIADYFHITLDELNGRETNKGYYVNEETAQIANEMKKRPELKTLFDASRKMTPEDIREVNALIKAKLQKPEYED